jgi:hypothetical protein
MSAAEVKRAWDRKMRNDDGSVPDEPRRKPCVIYLSDKARAVMHDELKVAQQLKTSPVLTSRLIEDLLTAHAAEPLRPKRAGVPDTTLRQRVAEIKMEAAEAKARMRNYQGVNNPYTTNIRTIRRLVAADFNRPLPTQADLAEFFRRLHGHTKGGAFTKLIDGLRPLFENRVPKEELRIKVLRQVQEYFDGLLQPDAAVDSAYMNWTRPRNSL